MQYMLICMHQWFQYRLLWLCEELTTQRQYAWFHKQHYFTAAILEKNMKMRGKESKTPATTLWTERVRIKESNQARSHWSEISCEQTEKLMKRRRTHCSQKALFSWLEELKETVHSKMILSCPSTTISFFRRTLEEWKSMFVSLNGSKGTVFNKLYCMTWYFYDIEIRIIIFN